MAVVFTFAVQKMDGSGYKTFKSQSKAEAYGLSLLSVPGDKVQITRTARGYAPYTYYLEYTAQD